MGAQNGYTFGFGLAIYVDHPFVIHRSSTRNNGYTPYENHPFPISFMMNELDFSLTT